MFWPFMISAFFITYLGYLAVMMSSKARFRSRLLSQGLDVLEEEIRLKKGVLKEIEHLEQGLCVSEEYDQAKEAMTAEEEVLGAERGRVTISEAEFEALETRLREMEEIERELEASQLETEREIEMLRTQRTEMESKKQELTGKIQEMVSRLDEYLKQLELSADQEERILKAKADLLQTEAKIEFYTDELSMVNERFLNLKKAYDALDIEYAQLYEKQSELEAAEP